MRPKTLKLVTVEKMQKWPNESRYGSLSLTFDGLSVFIRRFKVVQRNWIEVETTRASISTASRKLRLYPRKYIDFGIPANSAQLLKTPRENGPIVFDTIL